MPVMDGYEACSQIRSLKDPEKANIPIIGTSADAFLKSKQKCIEHGMNDMIGKPVSIESLLKVILTNIKM